MGTSGMQQDELSRVAEIAARRAGDRVAEMLDLAREALGVDAAYVTEFKDDEQVYRALAGDYESFGMAPDDGYPLEGSYCQRMVVGRIPSVVPDVGANAELAGLALTSLGDIGAYVGVPITLSDGRIWGTMCGVSHDASPLDRRAEALMQILSRMAAAEIEREIGLEHQQLLERRIEELEAQLASGAREVAVEGVAQAAGLGAERP
jgi:GAF domain-containing protein